MNTLLPRAAFAALLTAATPVPADVHLHYQFADGRPASDLYVRADRVLMARPAEGFSMLADTAAGSVTMLDHTRKTYMVMDRAAMQAMQARMEQVQKMMQAQMDNLTDEQRALLGTQMQGMLGAAEAPKPVTRSTGERRQVAGHGCEVMETVMSGRTMFSACVAPAASLSLPAADTRTLQAFGQLLARMGGGGGGMSAAPAIAAFEGVPLESTREHGGGTETLVEVKTDAVDATLFDIPAGFTRRDMPTGMQ